MKLIDRILFIQIQAISSFPDWKTLPNLYQKYWLQKHRHILTHTDDAELSAHYEENSFIHAEFSRVFCISAGYFTRKSTEWVYELRNFYSEDEKQLLLNFMDFLDKFQQLVPHFFLGGHSIRKYDIPFILRRFMVHRMEPPEKLLLAAKKWDLHGLDSMEIWKYGDYSSMTSLGLIALSLSLTPARDLPEYKLVKEELKTGNIEAIFRTCANKNIVAAQVYRILAGIPGLNYRIIHTDSFIP